MDLELTGKTALVTGASRGIGRRIALDLAAEGTRVAVVARRRPLLEELAEQIIVSGGPEPVVLEADVALAETPDRVTDDAARALGRIDILVNAAGGSRAMSLDSTKEEWTEGMRVNFFRLRELSQAVLPTMIKHRFGRVICITGSSEPRGLNAATSAKAAVHTWAKGLSREVAEHGITVNCIKPGRISSEQMTRMYPTDEDRRRFSEAEIPVGRFGEPHELSCLAVFLASPRAGYITGATIPVDGGISRFSF